jgi:hypothetical protein
MGDDTLVIDDGKCLDVPARAGVRTISSSFDVVNGFCVRCSPSARKSLDATLSVDAATPDIAAECDSTVAR